MTMVFTKSFTCRWLLLNPSHVSCSYGGSDYKVGFGGVYWRMLRRARSGVRACKVGDLSGVRSGGGVETDGGG